MSNGTAVSADQVRKLVRMAVILGVAAVAGVAAAALAVASAWKIKSIPVAIDARGVLTPAIALTEPLVSESRVAGFAEECLRDAFSHDFLHYDKTIKVAQECFTPVAADQFAVSIQHFVKVMLEKRMVMAVSIIAPPRVVKVGLTKTGRGEVATWQLQAKVAISFEGRSERIPAGAPLLAEITVIRSPLEHTPKGILIDAFNVGPARN